MLRNIIAAVAFACAALTPAPGRAQDVAQMESALAAMGGWMQNYLAVMTRASAPFLDMTQYSTAIERFSDGEVSANEARADIDAWRSSALAALREARAGAQAMQEPPSFAMFGADGERLDQLIIGSRASITPTIDEMERVVHAVADLGLSALDDRSKGYEARERALYQAAIQLTRVERVRIDLAAASLAEHHPTRYLAVATQHYYDTLDVMPRYLLAEYDGTADRQALVASLRASAVGMRAALRSANVRLDGLRADARALQRGDPAGARIGRVMGEMIETFPRTFAAYEGLAFGIEGAANAIEAGADVSDIWSGLDANDRPHLDEIDRLDRVRAEILTGMSRERL